MLYQVSFEKNTVCQCRIIDAPDADTARAYFVETEPVATLYGVSEHSGMIKPGMPVDRIPDEWKSLCVRIAEREAEIYAITRGQACNSREEWLDTQARALFQAANRIINASQA